MVSVHSSMGSEKSGWSEAVGPKGCDALEDKSGWEDTETWLSLSVMRAEKLSVEVVSVSVWVDLSSVVRYEDDQEWLLLMFMLLIGELAVFR